MNDFIYEFYFSKKVGYIEKVYKRYEDDSIEELTYEDAKNAIITMLGEDFVYEEKKVEIQNMS